MRYHLVVYRKTEISWWDKSWCWEIRESGTDETVMSDVTFTKYGAHYIGESLLKIYNAV